MSLIPSSKTAVLIGFLFLLTVLTGYNYFFQPFANLNFSQTSTIEPTPEPAPAVPPEKILFDSLSDEQKVAQLIAAPISLPLNQASASAELTWISQRQPGLVTLFGDRVATDEAELTIRQIKQSAQNVQFFIAVDHEGGSVQRLSGNGFTFIPSWRQTCDLSEQKKLELYTLSAAELAGIGVDLVLAPMLDYGVQNTILGSRICDSDPEVVAQNALLFAQVFDDQGILPVFKHFPGIGQTTRDLHTSFDRVIVSTDSARQYRQVLDLMPQAGVMVAHVGVENQYPDIPCSLSGACVDQLKTNYPQSLVITDALEMDSAGFVATGSAKPLPQRAVDAVAAGNQVLLFGPTVDTIDLEQVFQSLLQEYQQNSSFKVIVDQAVFDLIQRKYL